MKDDFRDSFTEFALDKRPSTPEVARVLREVRRQRGQKRPPYLLWTLGVGGWLVAAVSLTMLAKQSHEPREDQPLIQSDPDRVERPAPPRQMPAAPSPPEAPPPEAPAERLPSASVSPAPSLPPRRPVLASRPPPAPSASAPEPAVEPPGAVASSEAAPPASAPAPALSPRLPFEESLLLARGHFHRVEGILEVLRETGTSARTAAEQRCFAEPYQKILSLHEAARVQLARLDAAARSGDTLTFDLELERLVSLRRAADGEFQRVRVCFGAR